MAEPDVTKIVDLIMKNPKLIEDIRSIAEESGDIEKQNEKVSEANEDISRESSDSEISNKNEENQVHIDKSRRRAELLSALKPYLSSERGKTIEAMMRITDVLDMMKPR